MAWLLLVIAGILEIAFAFGMKSSRRFHATGTLAVNGRHRRVERRPAVVLVTHTAGGHRLCGLDRHRRGGHGDPRHGHAGRLRSAPRLVCIVLILGGVVGLKFVA